MDTLQGNGVQLAFGVLPDWQIRRDIKIEPFAEGTPRPGVISYGLSSYGYDVRVGCHFKVFGHEARLANISDTQAAWIAGILDGEGHLSVQKAPAIQGGPVPRITVSMACRETVEHLQQITGLGNITVREPSRPDRKPAYVWQVNTARHVQMLLTRILPYMITQRARAVRVIHLDPGPSGQTIVDPKNFDPTSFVDIEADSCLIPANSFALAETVEWLEIPRDVIAIAVGKSTFARCGVVVNVTPLEPEWRGRVTIEISNTTPLPAKIYAGEGIAQILFLRAQASCQVSYADKQGKYQDQKGLTLPFVLGSDRHT